MFFMPIVKPSRQVILMIDLYTSLGLPAVRAYITTMCISVERAELS
ncbi:MAG: hypothetical protein KGL63_12065 [Betaproteobacteria bacterium]|nr:hypothetical protein [Betaproteobacteria bacterium]